MVETLKCMSAVNWKLSSCSTKKILQKIFSRWHTYLSLLKRVLSDRVYFYAKFSVVIFIRVIKFESCYSDEDIDRRQRKFSKLTQICSTKLQVFMWCNLFLEWYIKSKMNIEISILFALRHTKRCKRWN